MPVDECVPVYGGPLMRALVMDHLNVAVYVLLLANGCDTSVCAQSTSASLFSFGEQLLGRLALPWPITEVHRTGHRGSAPVLEMVWYNWIRIRRRKLRIDLLHRNLFVSIYSTFNFEESILNKLINIIKSLN